MIVFITVTILWVFSVCLHEFGHALVAYRGGDHTVREKGYLSLNPLAYAHPVYSVALPVVFLLLGGIGLPGGAVYIEDRLLKSPRWKTAVALAGPAMNLLLAVLLSIPFLFGWLGSRPNDVVAASLALLIQLEFSAVLLCLLPIPPLDGFRAISPWLDRATEQRLLAHSTYFLWGLFLVLWYVPAANAGFWTVVQTLSTRVGVDPALAWEGWSAYRFWR